MRSVRCRTGNQSVLGGDEPCRELPRLPVRRVSPWGDQVRKMEAGVLEADANDSLLQVPALCTERTMGGSNLYSVRERRTREKWTVGSCYLQPRLLALKKTTSRKRPHVMRMLHYLYLASHIMPHSCSTILVHCIDFRFIEGIRDWMDAEGLLGDCDVLALPGAAKVLASSDGGEGNALLAAIDIGVALHGVRRVIFLNHMDCGAYGGHAAFASRDEERSQYTSDIDVAREVVQAKFDSVEVLGRIAQLSDRGSVEVMECA
jgi:hypothetical protein